jgi:hypothetical protein
MGDLYRTDFVLWTAEQAAALRSAARTGSNAAVDWENVAEEIESLGRSERSRLASHVRTVLEHLMKLEASPAQAPRLGWKETLLRVRGDITDVLDESPSLRRELAEIIARQTPRAARIVETELKLRDETARRAPETLSYSEDQVLGNWFPPD